MKSWLCLLLSLAFIGLSTCYAEPEILAPSVLKFASEKSRLPFATIKVKDLHPSCAYNNGYNFPCTFLYVTDYEDFWILPFTIEPGGDYIHIKDVSAFSKSLTLFAFNFNSASNVEISKPFLIGAEYGPRKTADGKIVKRELSMNLEHFVDWSVSYSQVNLMKRAREPISGDLWGTWNNGDTLNLDQYGNVLSLKPNQVARYVINGAKAQYPTGTYTLYYEGTGTIAVKNVSDLTYSDNEISFYYDSHGLIEVAIQATNPADPIRNIRVLPPGGSCLEDQTLACSTNSDCGSNTCLLHKDFYQQRKFHPDFLSLIQPYSTLRFLNWTKTNNSAEHSWSERATLQDVTYATEKAVPLELIAELSNLLGTDTWINVPHLADDNYVFQLANLFKSTLSKKLKLYLEYSNEVWNPIFEQAHYAQQNGLALNLSSDPFQAQLRYYALRAMQIENLAGQVFSNQPGRLVKVLATQSGNPWTSEVVLTEAVKHGSFDKLAIAPYFGGGDTSNLDFANEQAVCDYLHNKINPAFNVPESDLTFTNYIINQITKHKQHADNYGVELITYEAGQHLAVLWSNPKNKTLFIDTNRHACMEEVYNDFFDTWESINGGLVSLYRMSGEFGDESFGMVEGLTQSLAETPKRRAAEAYLTK
ncbi:MAG: hypothetical protein H6619_00010 [Deltaproteobacteria bacterium]|nr:hypothetical protein [Deltaproteobacteria bacterium]